MKIASLRNSSSVRKIFVPVENDKSISINVTEKIYFDPIKIASWRNASFTRCKFSRIKINRLPAPERTNTEGYESCVGRIVVPFENDESIGGYVTEEIYSGPIKIYNKKLHLTYRHNYFDTSFDEINVHRTWWGNYEAYLIDFHGSLIESVIIDNVHFSAVICDNTLFYNVTFTNMYFEDSTKIRNSKFQNCVFNKCVFNDIKFINTEFVKCEFNDSSFKECNLNIGIFDSVFNDIVFSYCVMPTDGKSFESKNNKFNDIKIRTCLHNNRELMADEDFMKYLRE